MTGTTGTLIPCESRQDWLAARKQGIGASEAAAAVGLSKWQTPLTLYLLKRGELSTDENEPMRWGTLLEPVIRQEYANRTGSEIVTPGLLRHPRHEFALATPDGIVNGDRLLEIKTARTAQDWGEPGSNEIPQEYMIQVQHSLAVVGLVVADVAVLVGGQDFRIYQVEADAELQDLLFDQEAAFWDGVLNSRPPAPINTADVRRRWRYGNGLSIAAAPQTVEDARRLRELKAAAKCLEQQIDETTAKVQACMEENSELVTSSGDVLATWKNVRTNPRFDLDRFKEEQPEVFAQYLREAAPQRRFLLKVKGEACLPQ